MSVWVQKSEKKKMCAKKTVLGILQHVAVKTENI